MIFIIPQKISKLRDGYVMTAIINFIGMIVVTDIMFAHVGWWSLLAMTPLYLYFFVKSISLALARCWIMERMNSLTNVVYSTVKQVAKTQILLVTNDRKLYRRRIILLEKHYQIHIQVLGHMKSALERLRDMSPDTIQDVTNILTTSDSVAKTKIFINEKTDL